MNQPKTKTLGILCALIGGAFWGCSGVCGQYLFQYKDVTAAWLVPIRLTVSGTLLLLYFLIRDRKKVMIVWQDKQNACDIFIYAIFGMMLCQYTYFQTIEWSNAATATVIQYMGPALIVAWACFSERRRPLVKEIIAVVLALTGIFLLSTHGNPGTLVLSQRALYMGLLSAITLAIYTVKPARLLQQFSSPLILSWGMLIGGIVLSLVMQPWNHIPDIDLELIFVLSLIIFLGTIASFSLYLHSTHLIGAVLAGLFACIEPVVSTILTVAFMGVAFTGMDFLGFTIVIITVFILAIPSRAKN